MEETFLEEIFQMNLSPNEFYVLQCLIKQERPKIVNAHLELRKLQSKDYLDKDFTITDKINKIKHLLTKIENKDKTVDNLDAYINIFPKLKLPSGKYARSHKTNIKACFDWFFKNYSYSWNTILKATSFYVQDFESKNYLYMMTSQYFICKTKIDRTKESELANYCEMYEDGTLAQQPTHFSEKVV